MPTEFPIIIDEATDAYITGDGTRFGWRFAYVNYEQFQLSIHPVDPRPGHNRLLRDPQAYINMPLSQIYTLSGALMTQRDFYTGTSYSYWNSVLSPEGFTALLEVARQAIAEGWLPAAEDEQGPVPFDMCPDDNMPMRLHGLSGRHAPCVECEGIIPFSLVDTYQIYTVNGYEEVALCYFCSQNGVSVYDIYDLVTCTHCAGLIERDATDLVTYYNSIDQPICHSCLDDELGFCEGNEHFVAWDEMDDDYTCSNCLIEGNNPMRFVRSWNYRPNLEFHPDIPTDPLRPLYIGIELEMSWPGWTGAVRDEASDWLEAMEIEYNGLLYAKSDSSVSDGFEVVTHPMEPQWALDNFPFQFFQDAINMGARETHNSVGTHIHIDKASLTTAQLWKILMLHQNLSQFCGTVGGRGTNTTYANWQNNTWINENIKTIAQQKGQAFGQAQRYVPVNVQNEQTIELRYMAGSIEPDMIRKNIEWVQALYDFTNYITVQDIKQGVLKDQSYLAGWVLNGKYPSLANYVKQNLVIPAAMPERTT